LDIGKSSLSKSLINKMVATDNPMIIGMKCAGKKRNVKSDGGVMAFGFPELFNECKINDELI
jgi:hypothetical protein